MFGLIVFLSLGAMCLAIGGFIGGLTWSAQQLGMAELRGTGLTFCLGFVAVGAVFLLIAGASS